MRRTRQSVSALVMMSISCNCRATASGTALPKTASIRDATLQFFGKISFGSWIWPRMRLVHKPMNHFLDPCA
jgi:hypothetical protein